MRKAAAFLACLWLASSARADLADTLAGANCPAGFACAQASAVPPPAVNAASASPPPPIDFTSVNKAASNFNSGNGHSDAVFRNALLDAGKQASWAADGTVYVKTGDIPAEWLRDSSAQVRPYLFFAKGDPAVAQFLKGVITRQARYLKVDPYANAFRKDYTVWEEKFELDSLCYPIMLAWTYWQVTGDVSVFTPDVAAGLKAALETMEAEQDHSSSPRHYSHRELKGNPVGGTGMIWTGFRPSDDACVYNFLIPAEMMAVVALGELAQIEKEGFHDETLAGRALNLRQAVHEGIQKYGVVGVPKHGNVYAYEVDGLGHSLLMDDGNIPSLLSAPYLGYGHADDPAYVNTRSFLLSKDNPYYYAGKKASGIGSPHTPKGYVWPLALLAQSLTAPTPAERDKDVAELLASDPGDGRLHESFDPNNSQHFTRKDFGWPNSLFAEFSMTTTGGAPPLPHGTTDDLSFARQE